MLLEEATQDVVQQLARVDRLQIERRLAARSSRKTLWQESIGAIAIDTQATALCTKSGPNLWFNKAANADR